MQDNQGDDKKDTNALLPTVSPVPPTPANPAEAQTASVPAAPAVVPAAPVEPMMETAKVNGEEEKGKQSVELRVNSIQTREGEGVLHVSVVPPNEGVRKPCSFICLLDISGSMGEEASVADGVESDGFSRLDLVKHSVKTIAHMLAPVDRMALIIFNHEANLKLGLTELSETGKQLVLTTLDGISHSGRTNIWAALKMGIELARSTVECRDTNTALLLFTDGEPNENPPRGIIGELQEFLNIPGTDFTLHSFGYGYNLDSKLLSDVANLGNGMYCYIPDATMVGTTFVNYLSNTLAVVEPNGQLEVIADSSYELQSLGHTMANQKLAVGALQFGQTRDFIFKFKVSADKRPAFHIKLTCGGKEISKEVDSLEAPDNMALFRELARCTYIAKLAAGMESQAGSTMNNAFLKDLVLEIRQQPAKDEDKVKALLRDIESPDENEGQVTKALSTKEWFQKWGRHYLRSLVRAHQLQQCHNFKDPGVQGYGGKTFKEAQDKADKLFCSLPPPKASIIHRVYAPAPAPAPGTAAPAARTKGTKAPRVKQPKTKPADMRRYMNCGSGCFDGEGTVQLARGCTKHIKDLLRDDELVDSEGRSARVVALIKFAVDGPLELVDLKGVLITPWHPVKDHGTWRFPCDLQTPVLRQCDSIYNLVLDRNHIVTINGVDLVTLGHGMNDNSVVAHPYFGSSLVLDDLRKCPGWKTGSVVLSHCNPKRDPNTGFVQSLV